MLQALIMNISKTKIKAHLKNKTNPQIKETIRLALKNQNWLPLVKTIASSARKYSSINLNDIDEESKAGDTILVIGKILSSGDITKKIRLCSLGISKPALEKLKKTKSEYSSILNEIEINPKAQGIKVLR